MRSVFFSFYYDRDIWRANVIRNSGVVIGQAAAGWRDASLWEEAKRKGDAEIRRMIDKALDGTTVTAVLIGYLTASRRYVDYEIRASEARGNGILGVRINNIPVPHQGADPVGATPQRLVNGGYPVYTWSDAQSFGQWVEQAYHRANP